MAVLTKMEILSANDLKQERVSVPEWAVDGEVIVRGATALERDDYEQSLFQTRATGDKTELKTDFRNAKARLAVKCMIDETGNRIFSDQDAEALGAKSSEVIDRIVTKIRKLSGMTIESRREMEKNSVAGQTESSPSSLPDT